jgi:gliding motility-associated-like protein
VPDGIKVTFDNNPAPEFELWVGDDCAINGGGLTLQDCAKGPVFAKYDGPNLFSVGPVLLPMLDFIFQTNPGLQASNIIWDLQQGNINLGGLYRLKILVPANVCQVKIEITSNPSSTDWEGELQCPTNCPTSPLGVVQDSATCGESHLSVQCNGSPIKDLITNWVSPNGTNFTGSDITVYEGGDYQLSTEFSNGCNIRQTVPVTISNLSINSLETKDVTCHGDHNGNAQVTVTGASANATYLWMKEGVTLPFPTNANTATDLETGSYTVKVSDPSTGCSAEQNFTITQPDEIKVIATTVPQSCGTNDGEISLDVSGGVAPYLTTWNGGNGGQTGNNNLKNLASGDYVATTTDSNGCETTTPVTVPLREGITVSTTTVPQSCTTLNDGGITLDYLGGFSPYTTKWDNDVDETGPALSNLAAGNYVATTSDSKGCQTITPVIVPLLPPNNLEIDVSPSAGGCDALSATGKVVDQDGNIIKQETFNNLKVSYNNNGTPSVHVAVTTDNGCRYQGSKEVVQEEYGRYIPNIFSPNADGVGDYFYLFTGGGSITYSMKIYDRWGSLVFKQENLESNKDGTGWDGKINGSKAANGVYVYLIQTECGIQNQVIKGDVTIAL